MNINDMTEDEQIKEIIKNLNNFQYVENPSEAVQLAAVKKNGTNMYFIKNPSKVVQLAAVTKTPFSIKYVQNPSEEIQYAAIKKDALSLNYIKNPSTYVIEKCKTYIIKKILNHIQNPDKRLWQLINVLIKYGIDWPELEIIKETMLSDNIYPWLKFDGNPDAYK